MAVPPFAPILAAARKRTGGETALAALLPKAKSAKALRATPDDRYLSLMCLRIFRAGLKHALVDARWPAFEEAFHGFDPRRVALMNDEDIERLMGDARLIRHLGKLRAVPANAAAMRVIGAEAGGFGAWLADWPGTEIVGLWDALADRFSQLGGNSGPYFLRMAGKDSFVVSPDVIKALIGLGIVEKKPTSKKDRSAVQAAFNAWGEESGLPLCHMSMILARSIG